MISYVPEHPRGLVYLFHGSRRQRELRREARDDGRAQPADRRGYGFVSTSRTERTGDKRWNVADPRSPPTPTSPGSRGLQANLVATTPLEANTPLVGIGMSNGARFVTLWGQSWKNAGYPVKAIWASHGNDRPAVRRARAS